MTDTSAETRRETDSIGAIDVPADAYWGAQTQRSLQNFRIGGERMPAPLIRALGIVKQAAARVNLEAGSLDAEVGAAIDEAAGEVIAGSLDDHFRFAPGVTGYRHRFFYPAGCGLRSFCDAAAAHLEGLGVGLVLGRGLVGLSADAEGVRLELQGGEALEAERLLWTLDLGPLAGLVLGEDPLSSLIHRTPMVLYLFLLLSAAAPAFTYYYDFDPGSLVYRASAPGFYGRQSNPQGQSYVAVEVVVPQEHEVWRHPERAAPRVWSELRASGFTDLPAPLAVKTTTTPVSFKNPKLGHGVALQKALERLVAAGRGRISWSDPGLMKKNDILHEVAALVGGGPPPQRVAG